MKEKDLRKKTISMDTNTGMSTNMSTGIITVMKIVMNTDIIMATSMNISTDSP